MIRIMRLLVLGVALLALGAPGAARADERVLARNQQEVNIHAYRGVAVFSLKQGSSYTLVASTAGGPPQPLNVPAQANVFDADIGRGRDGAPIVVVRLCAGATCTLNLLGLDGSPPVATGIEVPHGDVRPTVWDGTIAWYEHGRVRTKERTLARVEHGTRVLGLDLFGHELALNLDVSSPDAGVCGQRELRLVKFRAKHVRVLGSQLCRLNRQTFNRPALQSGGRARPSAGQTPSPPRARPSTRAGCTPPAPATRRAARRASAPTATAAAATSSPAATDRSTTGPGAGTVPRTRSARRTASAAA